MEDNNLLENIDFSENFLTQDKMKCELLLPTQCDSSVDSNETLVKHTTTRNCLPTGTGTIFLPCSDSKNGACAKN